MNFDTTNHKPFEYISDIRIKTIPQTGGVDVTFVTQLALKDADGVTQLIQGTARTRNKSMPASEMANVLPVYDPRTGSPIGQESTFANHSRAYAARNIHS